MTDQLDYQYIEFVDGEKGDEWSIGNYYAETQFKDWLADNQDKYLVSASHAFEPTGSAGKGIVRRILVVYRNTALLKK